MESIIDDLLRRFERGAFLITALDEARATPITLIQNWTPPAQ